MSQPAVVLSQVADAPARLRAAINRISRRLRPTKAGSGYTTTEVSVLETIALRGQTRLSDLADAEGLNPTMLSRVVHKLEYEGLIRRVPHPADKRASLVEASAAGRRLFERIRTERTDQLTLELDVLDPEDRSRLLAALPVLEELAERLKTRPR